MIPFSILDLSPIVQGGDATQAFRNSLDLAQLAAALGLPYAFASHFAPDALSQALAVYRSNFKPSKQLDEPYAMAGVNVFAADTDVAARKLFTSLQQAFANLRRGDPGPLPPPVDDIDRYLSPQEKAGVEHALKYSMVGAPATVRQRLEDFIAMTDIDEIMVTGQIFDHAARLRSFEITAEVRKQL